MLTQQDLYEGKGNRMTALKIEAFKREFPWLETCLNDAPVLQAYVSRIEPALLEHSLLDINANDFVYRESVFFVNEKGGRIEVRKPFRRRKYRFFGAVVSGWIFSSSLPRNFSIGEAMKEMGNRSDQIRYILSYHPYMNSVIIFKSPKGMTIREWIKCQIEKERKEIQSICAEIDAESAAFIT